MNAVMAFCGICLLLVVGKLLRSCILILQRLYLPASVIGGLVGLLAINVVGSEISSAWYSPWSSFPGFLINVVFASLFLGVESSGGLKRAWSITAPQLCYGQIVAWGQYVVGLGVVILLLRPFFSVPDVFGNLIEIGFEGGHGTVGGLAETFTQLGWAEGKDLGYTVATVGMIFGIVIGMILVNIAARKGHISNIRTYSEQDRLEKIGVYPESKQPHAGRQTVYPDSIDSLALHISLIGIAILLGYFLKQGLAALDVVMPASVQETRILQSFPLFPLCMIGGLVLQWFLKKTNTDVIADTVQMQRIAGTALDFLVVSAVASIRIEFVLAYWQPLLILCAVGIAWNVVAVLYLAPRIFKDAWFERSIAEFGQSMGVTATGLMLLRTVDPENKTNASAAFGYKQLIHEPIMGGGIWTSLAVPLVMSWGAGPVFLMCAAVTAVWLIIWWTKMRVTPHYSK
ncbi:MAG: sodium:glutamate symporter [Planctomycetes bacterium]|nr:sodium:glutamate symporter [Planctomycetota bacterium]